MRKASVLEIHVVPALIDLRHLQARQIQLTNVEDPLILEHFVG